VSREITDADRHWMREAIALSYKCPPAEGAYSVGAVIVDVDGQVLADGYSRENDPTVHAEESAIGKLTDAARARLAGATIYSTLEPCSQRKSRPRPCSQLVLDAGIGRVVIAWREPALFVSDCVGVETLETAGVTVLELPELAEQARAVNAHLDLS
jgi:diaminohydroxyphosphoribosylaminopyrimidine deaminase/5-amino-6-(5-phosphoribosylamino)uracil reductase